MVINFKQEILLLVSNINFQLKTTNLNVTYITKILLKRKKIQTKFFLMQIQQKAVSFYSEFFLDFIAIQYQSQLFTIKRCSSVNM